MKRLVPFVVVIMILTTSCSTADTVNDDISTERSDQIDNTSEMASDLSSTEPLTSNENIEDERPEKEKPSDSSGTESDENEEEPEPTVYDLTFNPASYELVESFPELSFKQPLYLTGAGNDLDYIYVVEKRGIIWRFPNDSNIQDKEVFLDISDRVTDNKDEKGLLGLAFSPDLKAAPYIYVYYTVKSDSVISRFHVQSGNPGLADPESETVVLTFDQPYNNHNGGALTFGDDGYLYIASGDGGAAGDPKNHGQNLTTLLGNVLRIDVSHTTVEQPYSIPQDNPFYNNDQGYAPEIYAYGLRNPWRMSFDKERRLLIAADVGQDKMEEIDIIENGLNYGWPRYEGTLDFKDVALTETDIHTGPIWTYTHDQGKSITGGYTYYGTKIPSLYGAYIYGDFLSGRIWALWINENRSVSNTELLNTNLKIASFGIDDLGELYVIDYQGHIYNLVEQ